jgi:hypothetical protein
MKEIERLSLDQIGERLVELEFVIHHHYSFTPELFRQ